ncbi:MAG: SBBP repeat-containing protein [Bryobacteraceae bacterium]
MMRSSNFLFNTAPQAIAHKSRRGRLTSVFCFLTPVFCLLPAPAAEPVADKMPLFFVENAGQASAPVHFVAQGSGGSAWFSPGEVAFRAGDVLVRISAVGSNPAAAIEGVDRLSASANFLIGPEEDWRIGVPLYRSIAYRDLYPGIDMIYGSDGRNLKSQYVVQPGADPSLIRIAYLGAGRPMIDESGALTISVDGSVDGYRLREEPPLIYQIRGGRRESVPGRFAVAMDGAVRFVLGRYDASLPLVIDPILVYSTLLGGSSTNSATAVAVDSTGDAYVAGFTASQNFPTASPEQNFNAGSNDAFIAKFSANGSGLIYCTYLGGSADDRAYAIAVNASGDAFVAGYTTSYNFPLRTPIQSSLKGARNAFVAKLSPAGNTLLFSTYLGGSGSDTAYGLALDSSGNAYVVGDTTSQNFPASNFQKTNRGSQNVFVAKIGSTGSALIYSTYLGGNSIDHGAAIAVDASGAAYLTGSTFSTSFPVSSGAYQAKIGGGQDAFVAKLSADGNSLVYGTFLGGSGGSLGYPESGQGIAVDVQGNVYVAGSTSSANFPVLGGVQTSLDGWLDAFAAKFGPTGALVYSTYLGGSGMNVANAIAVDASGDACFAGYTMSSDLPVTSNALQSTYGGDYDAFVARLNPAGNSLLYLSYLGGSSSDTATGIALDGSGNTYVAGWTLSPDFPVYDGYQSVNASNYAAFLAKFSFGTPPTNVGVTPSSGSGITQTFAFQFSDVYGASDISTVSVLFNAAVSTAAACSITYNQAANTLSLLTDTGALPAGTITPGSGSQQNSQCTLTGAGSSVSLSGNTLTLNLSIAFQSAFSGSKNVYLQATNPMAANSWQQMGSWTVVAAVIQAVGVTPASGTGTSQTFSFAYTDTKGYAAILSSMIIVNNPLSHANGCYVYFIPSGNYLYLTNNAGTAWQGPITIGQNATLQNSQCTVSASTSSFSGSGNNLTLNLALAFLPAFAGAKGVYAEVYDGVLDSGWVQLGTFTVTAAALEAISVTPSSGSGMSQTFSFLLSDNKGYATIASSLIIVNNTLAYANGCSIWFIRATNSLYLTNNAGTAWQGPITIGQSGTLQNSQCTLSAAGSSATGSGNSLTLNVAITFQTAFAGSKGVYIEVTDGTLDTGWGQIGSWTVP